MSRDFFWVDLSVLAKVKINFLVNSLDEEVKELVLVDCIVCLLWVLRRSFSKQTSQLISFVKY